MLKKWVYDEAGGLDLGVAIVCGLMLLVIMGLPVLAQMIERTRINVIREDTMDSVDYALKSAITALNVNEASAENFDFKSAEFRGIFNAYLAYNMKLNADLTDSDASMVDGPVTVVGIEYYGSDELPYTDPRTSKVYHHPFFTVELKLIINPSMFKALILELSKKEDFHYTFVHHVLMPIDN